ncbi:hypothetical protein V8E36_006919 [Tilletia maclaganii]
MPSTRPTYPSLLCGKRTRPPSRARRAIRPRSRAEQAEALVREEQQGMFIAFAFHKEQALGVEPSCAPCFDPKNKVIYRTLLGITLRSRAATDRFVQPATDQSCRRQSRLRRRHPRHSQVHGPDSRSTANDRFGWDLCPGLTTEAFASQLCADLGLSGEAVGIISHAIYEQLLVHRRTALELLRADELESR